MDFLLLQISSDKNIVYEEFCGSNFEFLFRMGRSVRYIFLFDVTTKVTLFRRYNNHIYYLLRIYDLLLLVCDEI